VPLAASPVHDLVRRLLARMRSGAAPEGPVGELDAAEYLSEERAARERALLGRLPVVVATDFELRESGACLAAEVGGVSVLFVRGGDGELRAFKNACRHRATRLVGEDAPCRKKALVCPYHGWTYDLSGRLLHVPHEEAFDGRTKERDALVAVHVTSRHGLVWAALEPFVLDDFLGSIGADLSALGLDRAACYRRAPRDVRGNWKLVIDAFLDAYHIRHLHRDTIYRFFLDVQAELEVVDPHVRSIAARRALLDYAERALPDTVDVRQLVTPSYVLFPNTVVIVHPDYVSVLGVTPISAGHTRFVHWMLVPDAPRTPDEEAHWSKSFGLIDEGVFQREDLFAVEAMQRGLETGADRTVLFGRHEHAALGFHARVTRALEERT